MADAQALSGTAAWLPAGAARPLVCWDAQRLRVIASVLESALADWQAAWGLETPAPAVACQAVTAAWEPSGQWLPLPSSAQASGWLRLEPSASSRIHDALFGEGAAGGPMSRAVAAACRQHIVSGIAALISLDEGAGGPLQERADVRPHSGAVEARMTGLPAGRLVIGAEAARALVQAPARAARRPAPLQPLSSIPDAMAGHGLLLQVQLQGCELDLSSLQALQLGDVVRLRHPLQAPAILSDGADRPLFCGFLGRRGARKAMELIAGTP